MDEGETTLRDYIAIMVGEQARPTSRSAMSTSPVRQRKRDCTASDGGHGRAAEEDIPAAVAMPMTVCFAALHDETRRCHAKKWG